MSIGTDEAEWFRGKAATLPKLQAQAHEMSSVGIRLTPGDPVVGGRGDVMWAADRPTLHLADGTTTRLRATLIASRVDGRLVIEHMHLSVPAPNEEVVAQTLTV